MMKKKTAAVFPVFSDTIPIIRYLYSQSDEYNIVELLSPSGCGVCGMDAGYADNKSHLGITVVDYKNSKFDGWDYLILLHHAHNERDGYQAAYEEVLKKAGALGKRIISKPAASNASNLEIGPPYHWLNYAEKNSARVLEQYVSHKIRFPNIVTLLVGELINDHSGITPFLNLFHTLSKYAKTVLISTESNLCTCGAISFQAVLSNWDLSERDKILYMNKAVCDIYDYLNTDHNYKKDDEVEGRVYLISDNFGAFVAVDDEYSALIPKKELYGELKVGQKVKARISRVEDDGKLTLSIRKKAYMQMDDDAERVMKVIEAFDGVLPFNDKASPETIRREFGMSKNEFKRAVGRLYKERRIEITDTVIRKIN